MIRTYKNHTIADDEVIEVSKTIQIQDKNKGRLGVMLVGWGGNNGSTFTAGVLARQKKLKWQNKHGTHDVDFVGSLFEYGSLNIEEKNVLYQDAVDMYSIDDLVISGWDINKDNIYDACKKTQIIDLALLEQMKGELSNMVPLPSAYDLSFIASNQKDRADNFIKENEKEKIKSQIRKDIHDFKKLHKLDQVIVMWTASTERFHTGKWKTHQELEEAIKCNDPEVSPSILFAVAAIQEGCIFLNGSPQNTLCPSVINMAEVHGVFIGGEDFKTGQTKLKSVLVDFLASSGIRPLSVVSYNHLGNNDGKNLDEAPQFRSKEVTKTDVIDDIINSNPKLITKPPDHAVVIKYIPAVRDSKRAMDEYFSQLFLDGRHTLALHNTCEDTLLAVPLMLDLVMFAELFSRIKRSGVQHKPVLSLLSFFFKAPVVNNGEKVINAFFRQRYALENFFRICLGYPTEDFLYML